MIKFKSATVDGRTLLGFGLSRGNLQKLLQGHPVHVNMEEMGMPGLDFMIFGDIRKTDAELAEDMKEFITDETVVRGSTDPQPKQ